MIIVLVCPLTLFFIVFGIVFFSGQIMSTVAWIMRMLDVPGVAQLIGVITILGFIPLIRHLGKLGKKQNSGC